MLKHFFQKLITLQFSLIIITYNNAQVVPGDSNAVKVEFRFNHELASTDSGVGINGSFNNWLGGVFPMQEYEPDWWKVTLDLLQYGYEYKFVTYTDTVGQSGVTGYFTDPLNPVSGGPFNNSIVTVKSPMIYYFLPKTGTTAYTDRPTIMANISFANRTQLDVSRMTFMLDGQTIPNASSFYDVQTRKFTYIPPQGMTYTQHIAFLKVFDMEGDSATLTTTFDLSSFYNVGSYTFMFDSKSPNFDYDFPIERVDAKGDFNSWGNALMTDPDSDGVYKYATNLDVNETNEYIFVVNSGLYINDPDNPDLSNNYRTFIIKRLESYPRFTGFNTSSGQIFPHPSGNLTFSATIVRNDTLVGIDTTSLSAKLDGAFVPVTKVQAGTSWQIVVNINSATVGKHVIEFFGADIHDNQAEPVKFVFGLFPENSGFHFVDGDADDTGPGTYIYRNDIPVGSGDISELTVEVVPTMDSLIFFLKLNEISEHSRIGFYIVNNLDGEYVLSPDNAMIKIPEWNNRGVYFTIVPRNSPFFNSSTENIVYILRDPVVTDYQFSIDSSQISSGEISFKIPLTVFETVLGSYRNDWFMGAYSYFKDQSGTIKVGSQLGGHDFDENPNIYDATFLIDNKIQEKIIGNYIEAAAIGGPRIAVIGSKDRGSFSVHPTEIDTALGNAPEINLLATGGTIRNDTVRVFGFAAASQGTVITLHVNENDTTIILNSNQMFEALISLDEGMNRIYASMIYNGNLLSTSSSIIYNRIMNHTPKAKVYSTLNGNFVTMYADSSYDPDGGPLNFLWEQDVNNPEQVTINGFNTPVASFTVPATLGEYYFTLKATGTGNRTGWVRTITLAADSGVFLPDYGTWHPTWVDTQVVYSVFVKTFSHEGNFDKLTEKLPELKELGINTIWLLPVHPTTNNIGPDNPGYAITDYYDVNENYGTLSDFEELVNSAHQNGIRIIMDHVIQHTSVLHPFMKDADVYKNYSPYYPFYMWDSNNNYIYLFTWVDLPSINYEQESTREYLLNMAEFWVQDLNVDGFRCDVAWAINDLRPSGPAYWQSFRKNLKAMKPDIFLLAEADARFTRFFDKKFDAAYDWNWYSTLKSVINGSSSIDSLNAAVEYFYNPQFPKFAKPFRFLENQDEQRFIEAFGLAATKMGAALMFSSPGVPHLYAGQEVGELTYRGIINWNDPDNLRVFYKKLISIRAVNDALVAGNFTRVPNSTPASVYSFLRTYEENNVISLFNFSGSQTITNIHVPIELLAFDSTETFYLNDVLNNQSFQVVGTQLRNYAVTLSGTSARIFVLSYTPISTTEEEEVILPSEYYISQNYPNPFNPSTRIKYNLPFESSVKIRVFNILGEKITDLVNEDKTAGFHEVVFNANRLASGVYFYTIEASSLSGKKNFSTVKKMILLK